MSKALLICAAASAALLSSTTPALAMTSTEIAEVNDQTQAIVSLRTSQGGTMGECTGTAIAPQWILTAGHCIMHQPNAVGQARIGQGDDTRTVDLDHWEIVGADVALIHTAQDMELKHYYELDDQVRTSGQAQAYGWSNYGSTQGRTLPTASADITGQLAEELITAEMHNGAKVQGGDSGGPLMYDGAITAVLTTGLSDSPSESTTDNEAEHRDGSTTGGYTPVANYKDQILDTIAQEPRLKATNFNPWLLGGIAAAILVAVGASWVAMRGRR